MARPPRGGRRPDGTQGHGRDRPAGCGRLDYAETRTDQLLGLLEAAVRAPGASFRILLLARTADDWWPEFQDRARLEELYGAPGMFLSPLEPQPADRADAYRQAVDALALALPRVSGQQDHDWPTLAACVTGGPSPGPYADRFQGPGMEMALTLHMTALADLLDAARDAAASSGAVGAGAGTGALEERLLSHERVYWRTVGEELGLKRARAIDDALAAAFLCGAADPAQADALLARVPGLEDQSADTRGRLADWIAALYPSPDDAQVWGSLHPDRLAEFFVGDRLCDRPGLPGRLVEGATEAQATGLLTLLTRAAAHTAHRDRLDAPLTDLCVRHPRVLGPLAVDVATQVERPEPLVAALYRLTDGPGTDFADLTRLADRLPRTTHHLAAWALHVTQRLTDLHRARAQEDPATAHVADLATMLRRLCFRLGAMGKKQQGYAVSAEAVRMLKLLAQTEPDTFLPHLAACLHNLSTGLDDLGRWQEAVGAAHEAVALYRRITSGPASGTYLPELAYSLCRVAHAEGKLGRAEEALAPLEEAVTIRRDLVAERGDVHRPELADGLNDLALWWRECGRLREALEASGEAAGLYRTLAEERPDAFRPGLAMILSTHSSCLGSAGRRREALRAIEEAVHIRRDLVRKRSDVFRPDLARCLNSLAVALGELGRHRDSLAAVAEAVELYRSLNHEDNAVFRDELAMTLNTYANDLQEAGRKPEALEAARKSVDLYGTLAEEYPEAFTADLAMSLLTYASQLSEAGREGEALETNRRVVGLYRPLAEARPEVFRPALARSLNNLSRSLGKEGLTEESLEVLEEAVTVNRRILAADPAAPAQHDLAMNLMNRAVAMNGAGRRDEAVDARAQAVDILRELVRTGPEGAALYAPQLGAVLVVLGEELSAAGRLDEAADAMLEAVVVTRQLRADDPGAHLGEMGLRLACLCACMLRAGRRREAPAVFEELIGLLEGPLQRDGSQPSMVAQSLAALGILRHTGGHPDARSTLRRAVEAAHNAIRKDPAHEPSLVWALHAQGMELAETGEHDQGLSAVARAVGIARRLAGGDPAHEPVLAQTLDSLGRYLAADVARRDEALEATAEAVTRTRRLVDAGQAQEGSLATVLANHGLRLADAGGFEEEALSATEEALILSRSQAEVHLAANEPGLAYALYAYAKVRLLADTELPQARDCITQALKICYYLGCHEPGLVAYGLPDAERTRNLLCSDGSRGAAVR
ncbi:tetratricopeptide repeat protein [Streptomyces sp. NBC_01408]|uniref:tetratricopeptide repeat protein n=1 Tax=Streptomyces sp. NBC_01408 TaxID=2903855 RepID=UPI0022500779|nr:tetratricopeptide repeat protein [Streptomyces sp. NBC_01408]MCX4695684.1 tetratricopeptide repeat protein [Streptomyces sp. NBC_01408]